MLRLIEAIIVIGYLLGIYLQNQTRQRTQVHTPIQIELSKPGYAQNKIHAISKKITQSLRRYLCRQLKKTEDTEKLRAELA